MRLARIFQDGMVFQRNKPIRFWGRTDKSESIQIKWNGSIVWEGVVEAGTFEIFVPAMEVYEDGEFEFSCGIYLRNIDIGEVWIAGGQSNMEFPLGCEQNYVRDSTDTIYRDDAHFRFYDVGEFAFVGEREEGLKPAASHWDRWMKFDQEHAEYFSAVGAYYGLILRRQLQVPIGIIGCNWGGTTASAWLDKSLLAADEDLSVYLREYEEKISGIKMEKYEAGDLKRRKRMSFSKAANAGDIMFLKESVRRPPILLKYLAKLSEKVMPIGPHSERRPGGLYENMVSEIAGYICKGVIWYQGESDEHHADAYGKLFGKLIENWRELWDDNLPFVFTQLAPFDEWMGCNGKNYPELREQQQIVEDTVPNTYMVSIMDAGSRYDIHPKNKKIVGERMAYLSLDEIYQKKSIEAHAPRILSQKRNGKDIILDFQYAGKGLTQKGELSSAISVVQKNKEMAFTTDIQDHFVIIHCPELQNEDVWVSFGYKPYMEMPLFNKDGIAARPSKPIVVSLQEVY